MREDDIDTFLAARWSSLFRLACLLTGSAAEADDLLQESLVKVYLRWTKISRTQVPEAYVRRMMVNTLVSRSRRPYRRRELLEVTVEAVRLGRRRTPSLTAPGSGPWCARCPFGSARSSCSATTRTCRSRRSQMCSAARPGA